MKIGIIGAMEEEIRLLKGEILDPQFKTIASFEFIEGRLGNHEVVLIQSGIGKVNASIVTTLLITNYQVDLIINTGTAGGLHPGLKVGDIVIADSLIHHDVDVTGFGYAKGQMAGMPEKYYPNNDYMRVAKHTCRILDIEPVLGQVVSGDQFINSAESIERIRTDFPKAKACEMESAAIAQTAEVLHTPYVIIRAISDNANEEAAMSFDDFVVLAGKASATIVQQMLLQLA